MSHKKNLVYLIWFNGRKQDTFRYDTADMELICHRSSEKAYSMNAAYYDSRDEQYGKNPIHHFDCTMELCPVQGMLVRRPGGSADLKRKSIIRRERAG